MSAGPDLPAGQTIETLQGELAAMRAERDEAQAREAAFAEVLQAINACAGDPAPVFDLILEKATRLCGASFGALSLYRGDDVHESVASRNVPDAVLRLVQTPQRFGPETGVGRLVRRERFVHIADAAADDGYRMGNPVRRALVDDAGARSYLAVPIRKDGALLGAFTIYRSEVRPFTERQVTLVEAFAAQAALALENARLLTEQREALERQTATAEVLEVINASPGNLEPVFGTMLEKAMRLCQAAFGVFGRFDGKVFDAVADIGVPPALMTAVRRIEAPPPRSGLGRLAAGESVVQFSDLADTDVYRAGFIGATALVDLGGARTAIFVSLRKDDAIVGAIVMYRREVRLFTDKQIALLQNFAAQAVIAMENARLLTEQREALEQQTATAEILRAISQSPTDVRPVLDAVVKAAVRFCGATDAVVGLRDAEQFEFVAQEGPLRIMIGRREPLNRETAIGRAVIDAVPSHLVDIPSLDPVEFAGAHELSRDFGFRTALAAPMLRDGQAIGAVALRKPDRAPFTPRQAKLLETFAAQAVIAIENVRLFTELREALDQQTASAEVLRVISQSPTDAQPALHAIVSAARRFCSADDAYLSLLDGDELVSAAADGPFGSTIGARRKLDSSSGQGRIIVSGRTTHFPDVLALEPAEFGTAIELARRRGHRAALGVPLMRDGAAIGALSLRKAQPGPFSDRQISLLETFAAQAVIAIENVRLFTELRTKNAALTSALEQQTATADILQVISQSPTDVQPVFDAIVKSAVRLCEGLHCALYSYDGALQHLVADHGVEQETLAQLRATFPRPPDPASVTGSALLDGRGLHVPDLRADPRFNDPARAPIRAGYRAALAMPMMKDGRPIGVIYVVRREPRPFGDAQVELLQTFAAQAVIAIENVRLFTELRESLEQQTATSEILRVISQSPTDVTPVLRAVAKAALRFCGGEDTVIGLREGDRWLVASHEGPMRADVGSRVPLTRETSPGQAMLDAKTSQLPDILALDPVEFAAAHDFSRRNGFRAAVAAPMLREGVAIGAVVLRRAAPGAFTARQIALLEGFAAQAVIAIENTRLFTELREALEQQTATADILQTINGSPGNLQPVFDVIVDKAMTLCDAAFGMFNTFDGERFHTVATRGVPEAYARFRASNPPDYGPHTAPGRLIAGEDCIQEADLADSDLYRAGDPNRRSIVDLGGARTILNLALRKEGRLVGMIAIYRQEVRPFNDKQIALVRAFADQAVIAMENARLLGELRERTDDLTESLEYQTAIGEVLEVIGRSTGDLQPVLDAMLAAVVRLCGVERGGVAVLREGKLVYPALVGGSAELDAVLRSSRNAPSRRTAAGRAVLDRAVVHILDTETDPEYAAAASAAAGANRALLAAPLMRDGEALGAIVVGRIEPAPFGERQIALLRTFADQAVIAMENARLLSELTQRTDALTLSLEYQTATSELLQVVSRSTSDIQPVLDAMLASAARLCGSGIGGVVVKQGDAFWYQALLGGSPDLLPALRARPIEPAEDTVAGRTLLTRDVVHVADLHAYPDYALPQVLNEVRTALGVPLLREDELLGAIVLTRDRVEPFTERQIALLETFADQAVIAMENARLLGELRESLEQQTATAEVLETINASPGDLKPVFDAILAKAMTLCEAAFGTFATFDGQRLRTVATRGVPDAFMRYRLSNPPDYGPNTGPARLIAGEDFVHDVDAADSDAFRQGDPNRRAIVELGGARTILNVALRKDGVLLGSTSIYRQEVRPFSDAQIALVQGFADQAVIAMENARLLGELRESLDQQTAMADVLQVISRSPGDLQPVFEAMLDKAMNLCQASFGMLTSFDGEVQTQLAMRAGSEDVARLFAQPIPIEPESAMGRLARNRDSVLHVLDAKDDEVYRAGVPSRVKFVDGTGARTALWVALRKDGQLIGAFIFYRHEVRAFNDKQIALLRTFADQAVIAMENARLLSELRESLDQQTAMADVLGLINSSTGDITPVFDAMVDKATALCESPFGVLFSYDGQSLRGVSTRRSPQDREGFLLGPIPISGLGTIGRALREGKALQTPDLSRSDAYRQRVPLTVFSVEQIGIRTVLFVPLMSERGPVGMFGLYRTEVRPFTDQQVALVEAFAQQAVVAMENARLLSELTRREEELRVTFDHMGDGVMMFDAGLKMASWNRNFQELLDIPDSFLATRPGLEDYIRLLVGRGELGAGDAEKQIADYRERIGEAWSTERTRPDGRILEVRNNPVPGGGAVLIYSDITERKKAEQEIRVARDAAEAALERQTATAEILKVIASSPTDVRPVLHAVAKAAVQFCGTTDAIVHLKEGDDYVVVAHEGPLRGTPGYRRRIEGNPAFAAMLLDGEKVHYPDIEALDHAEVGGLRQVAADVGFRAVIGAPLLREGTPIGSISLRRVNPGAFTPQQIELLETFAAQAVIAVENVRLFTELRDSLERLKAAQANLVQSEKMASLGQLTAGIAHEIKNPLNFVNNFASLSVELLDELKEIAGPALETLDADRRADLDETMGLLTANLGKIAEHGKRADGIVKSMLSHSRGGSGDWQASDIDALVEEALNLAYHGARAQDNEFNVTLERDFARTGRPIEVVPQDVTRVFLNLIGNGFYAANRRRLADKGFRPTLKVSTRDLGEAVEVRVRDNGTGMTDEVREKLFQPFFTTKPTGEGTGLGLSISYDIVTQQHGGTIAVESELGQFTEFTVRLPRSRRTAKTERA